MARRIKTSIIDNSEIKVEKDVSIAYICCSSGYRKPHLDARKCMELGVSPGPCITQLQRGNDITLKDGTILKAEEVLGNKSWNSTVIVVECPTLSFLDSLLSAEAFKEFQDPHHRGGNTVVAHLTPLNVMKDPRYIQWMSSFPPDTYHLVVNENNLCNGHGTVLWRQNFMHLLNPQIFPLLRGVRAQNTEVPAKLGASKFAGKVLKEFADSCIVHDFQTEHSGGVEENKVTENTSVEWRARWGSEAAGLQLIEARTGTLFSFGCNPVQRNQEPWWNDSALHYIVNSVPVVKNVLDGVNDVYKKMGIYQETNPKETFPHVVFLGTSAASAIRYRNTSSILLNISQDKSILMDCGEGTILQLQALYEEAELQKVLCSIRAIYISHLHADHHLGLSSVLQARKKALAAAGNVSQPLLLLAPHTITDWLSLIHYHFTDVLNNVTFVPLKDIDVGRHLPSTKHIDDLLLNQLEMQLVTTCKVDHCIFAYGVTFCHKDGWKITYSGDTMYCDALAKMGTNSDLLIHEATFGNTLGFMARAKRHSTTDDAVLCGEVMQAKFTILTHFSQRYHFMPQIDELLEMNKSNVSISFDFMKVNLQDLPTLHLLHHAYLELFRKQQERVKRRLEKILMKVNKRR